MEEESNNGPVTEEDLINCLKCSQIIISPTTARKCPNDAHHLCATCALSEHGQCPQCKAQLEPAE